MRTGPLLMIAATLVLTAMSGAVKIARVELTTMELIFWRGAIAVPLAWVLAQRGGLHIGHRRTFAFRLGLGFCAMVCFFTALKGLPLADTNLITKVQPVLIALCAPWFLGAKERASPKLWGLLIVGLTGCAVLMAPNLMTGSVWGLWAFAASILSAGAHIALRGLKEESSTAIVFWFQLGVLGLSTLVLLATQNSISLPSAGVWPAVLAVGILATAGQLLMTFAYAKDTASRIAAVRFIGPVWGIAGDVLFFSGWPDTHVWIGGAIVVIAGLAVTLQRDPDVDESTGPPQ